MDTQLSIVVVEDHEALREVTVEALRGLGHSVIGVDCAEAMEDLLGGRSIGLMVIDVNLPHENGFSLAARMRAAQPDVGIIMVTARAQLNDKLTGYKSGADLYLTKPTSVEELGAAVQAFARRLVLATPTVYQLDASAFILQGPDNKVHLTSSSVAILSAFARAPAGRLESWQLLELSGGADADANKGTLEVQMVRLRKKIFQAGHCEHPIKAIRGWGYQLCIQLSIS
jgi:DNA-binding response OmpR family regulator